MPAALTWVLFGLAAVLILAIGAFFSLRRNQLHALADDQDDAEPVDVAP